MYAVKTEKLYKKFGDQIAVNGIDLNIEKGQLYGLLGVNGAGKTTTIRMLSCLSKPTSGKATVNGYDITTQIAEVKQTIDVSPQETAVAQNLTVRENLVFMSELYGDSHKTALEKAETVLKDYSLTEVADKKAKLLSGGFARRLSIAMAIITDPEILFLDEPTLGLDVLSRRELWKMIENMKGRITVILTTHYLEEAEALCDRISVMSNGIIKAEGTVEELKKLTGKNSLEEAFIAICEG